MADAAAEAEATEVEAVAVAAAAAAAAVAAAAAAAAGAAAVAANPMVYMCIYHGAHWYGACSRVMGRGVACCYGGLESRCRMCVELVFVCFGFLCVYESILIVV